MSDLSTQNNEKKPSKLKELWSTFAFFVKAGCILFFAGFIVYYSIQEFADMFRGMFSFFF